MTQELDKRAGKASRSLVKIAWRAGETSTEKLAEIGKTTQNAVRGWIPQFEKEELGVVRMSQDWLCSVTDESVEIHKKNADKIKREVERTSKALAQIDPISREYRDLSAVLLRLEKRWAEMVGVEAMLAAYSAGLVANAMIERKEEEKPPLRSGLGFTPSGSPIVPLD